MKSKSLVSRPHPHRTPIEVKIIRAVYVGLLCSPAVVLLWKYIFR
jgi:hypothetical protein